MISVPDTLNEQARTAALRDAQQKALALFDEIARDLIRPGITEHELSAEIHALAAARFGVETHWHKRVIRAGPNTLTTYNDEPADRTIAADDILFVDLGPVFAAWEADFGRTYVLGDDPAKLALRDALAPVFATVKAHFDAHPEITGAELYQAACDLSAAAGWEFGGTIAGHLVGAFPHERIEGNRTTLYITPGCTTKLHQPDASGLKRHWILEIHLVDRARGIGGFYEQLLTVG